MSTVISPVSVSNAPKRSAKSPLNRKRIYACIIGTIWLLLILPAVGVAGISVMASDSGSSPAVTTFIVACFTLPAAALIAAAGAFMGAAMQSMRIVAISSVTPLIALAIAIGAMVAMTR